LLEKKESYKSIENIMDKLWIRKRYLYYLYGCRCVWRCGI